MDYFIRFIQMHESFRKAEIDAIATLHGIELEWVSYSERSPFAIIRFKHVDDTQPAAERLIKRSILAAAIYELWGSAASYTALHEDVRNRSGHIWSRHRHESFRFELDSFQGKHSMSEQREIIESFSYTGFEGPIQMRNPDNQFVVFEEYNLNDPVMRHVHFGRHISDSGRKAVVKYNLKKRKYIATTSMDAELSLVTANMALAAHGKLAYDPFVGTGSFPLACAHFGATVFGSDLDGRSIRGTKERNVKTNFMQYGTLPLYLGGFIADVTNTPLRFEGLLDAIVCDPPYGVREGLKVLGSNKKALQEEVILADGTSAHLSPSYIPPKKPYSFVRMLDDILDFSSKMLVANGRLCMWMPIAGETSADQAEGDKCEYAIPTHPALELVSECTQHFNKWSRRLLVYRRLPIKNVDQESMAAYEESRVSMFSASANGAGSTADDLNAFRKKYFQGFRDPSLPRKHEKLPHKY